MNDKSLRVLASIGLGVGGALGLSGMFAPSASLRGLAGGIDGVALVLACVLLTLRLCRLRQNIVAAGFLVDQYVISAQKFHLGFPVPCYGPHERSLLPSSSSPSLVSPFLLLFSELCSCETVSVLLAVHVQED